MLSPLKMLQVFNSLEAAWWMLLAVILVVRARGQTKSKRGWTAGLAAWLILFGVSDIIEVSTGAFWRPWWLLALKGTCLVGVASCAAMLWRIHTAARRQNSEVP